ncbi:hypothetical protein BDA96_06G087500 [Sorghum bicolor]|uniref:Uncharacterized protein n=1 Tax=Sorghum bicolor TaxID=4558 RepID=A0A921UCI0_SORBI|nr:hypothetical protein BDA96_06G087500 [Sorghum bicolor]
MLIRSFLLAKPQARRRAAHYQPKGLAHELASGSADERGEQMQRPSMEARASAHSSGPLASRCGGASGSDGSMRAKQFLWRRVSKALRWVPAAARVVGGQHSGFARRRMRAKRLRRVPAVACVVRGGGVEFWSWHAHGGAPLRRLRRFSVAAHVSKVTPRCSYGGALEREGSDEFCLWLVRARGERGGFGELPWQPGKSTSGVSTRPTRSACPSEDAAGLEQRQNLAGAGSRGAATVETTGFFPTAISSFLGALGRG